MKALWGPVTPTSRPHPPTHPTLIRSVCNSYLCTLGVWQGLGTGHTTRLLRGLQAEETHSRNPKREPSGDEAGPWAGAIVG